MRSLRPESSLKLLGATVVTLALALSGVVLWLSLNPDPLGGEPYVVIPLNERLAAKMASPAPASRPGNPALRISEDGLTEEGRFGPLPRIAPDGRTPRMVYAKPQPPGFLQKAERPPAILLIVAGLGLNAELTFQAIDTLPPAVGLAFSPYGRGLSRWSRIARDSQHEVLLELPLEPYDYPDNDPGPHTLLTKAETERNLTRLHWVLSRMGGYVGLVGQMGSRFSAKAEALAPVFQELKLRGLLYLDNGLTSASQAKSVARRLHLPFLSATVARPGRRDPAEMAHVLSRLVQRAKKTGLAIGIIRTPSPRMLKELAAWPQRLAHEGVALVSVTTALAMQRGSS